MEAAATAEYYINLTCHFFADGCGKCAMATAAWLLMRGNHPLPVYPGREVYYGISRQLRCAAVGSDNDREDFSGFLRNYRNLFREDAALQQDAEEMTILLPNRVLPGTRMMWRHSSTQSGTQSGRRRSGWTRQS